MKLFFLFKILCAVSPRQLWKSLLPANAAVALKYGIAMVKA